MKVLIKTDGQLVKGEVIKESKFLFWKVYLVTWKCNYYTNGELSYSRNEVAWKFEWNVFELNETEKN